MGLVRLTLVLVCLFTLPGVLHAQPDAAEQALETDARRLYAEGKLAYAQGRFEAAITLFERAYTLSEAPALLFNLAQAHRLAGPSHCREAFALYRSYLSAVPRAENRREVEERVAALSACANQPAPEGVAPAPARAASPPLAPPEARPLPQVERPSLLGPVLVSALGAAALAGGVVLYVQARNAYRDAERDCPCYPGTFTKWERRTNWSYATMAVGGTALASGVTWWLMVSPPAPGSHATLGVRGRF